MAVFCDTSTETLDVLKQLYLIKEFQRLKASTETLDVLKLAEKTKSAALKDFNRNIGCIETIPEGSNSGSDQNSSTETLDVLKQLRREKKLNEKIASTETLDVLKHIIQWSKISI